MTDAYVWIDPARRSGEPCIGGHRLPVELIVDNVWAEGVDFPQSMWNLTRAEVLVACWYVGAGNVVRLHGNNSEYVAYRGSWRKRWGAWAKQVHDELWNVTTCDYDAIPDPPNAERN